MREGRTRRNLNIGEKNDNRSAAGDAVWTKAMIQASQGGMESASYQYYKDQSCY